MAENRISYLDKNYDEYRTDLLRAVRRYYPELSNSYNDASLGSWFIDLFADIADNLSYSIDRSLQETTIESAQERSSLLNIARTSGLRVPGRKAAIVEVELSCRLPLKNDSGDLREADERYAPYVKRGTLFSTGRQSFELQYDVDFKEQFDENGLSNRIIVPIRDSNGVITGYEYRKLAIAVAGQSKIYKQVMTQNDVVPFMTITLSDSNILGVESIIVKDGTDLTVDPPIEEFSVDKEEFKDRTGKVINRYFEVDSLIEQYRFGYESEITFDEYGKDRYYNPIWEDISDEYNVVNRRVTRGHWCRLKNKFITEYTDNGQLNITFGAGLRNEYGTIPDNGEAFTRYMMSRMEANDYMGVLPEPDHTIFVLYRSGGGLESNIAQGTLTNILYYNVVIDGNCNNVDDTTKKNDVLNSLSVTNTTPSYGGKDEPSNEELKYIIKYNAASQNRCVTLHDYEARIMKMPAKYGTPFRFGVMEENNKVCIYTLGMNHLGQITSALAEPVAENMKEYLSNYKMINDFVEIKSGKVINIAFKVDVFIDKTYDKSEVVKRIIDTVYDYMDVRRHLMGEDIFLGDLAKEISKLDGVINLIRMKVYNKVGNDGDNAYSEDEITQTLVDTTACAKEDYDDVGVNFDRQIDLDDSDQILFSDTNSMFEIKYKNTDIIVGVKQR